MNYHKFTREELEAAYHTSILSKLIWGIADNEFNALPREEAIQLVRAVYPLPLEYDPVRRNCRRFAEVLRYRVWEQTGWTGVGVICDYDGYHWYNCVLLVKGNHPLFELIEPQSGKFVKPGDPVSYDSGARYDLQKGWLML